METYYNNDAVSQSKLKLLMSNPALFNAVEEPELYFEEKKHFIVGSAVDCILTEGQASFEEKYYLSELENKPSDTLKSIINMVFDEVVYEEVPNIYQTVNDIPILSTVEFRERILNACNEHNYQPTYREQTRINKVCEHYEYWEDIKRAYNKQVLSSKEYDLISQIVMSLNTNDATRYYLGMRNSDIQYQVPIYFKYEEVDCKALLDMVIFDHNDKTILPIDIKTMGDYTLNFPKALRRRRYDIQAAFYTEALKYQYPDYEILPFKFIVESTIEPGTPLIYTLTQEVLDIGKYGRPELEFKCEEDVWNKTFRQPSIKGFKDLIKLYKYYTTNGFELDQKVRENDSELTLDWSGII